MIRDRIRTAVRRLRASPRAETTAPATPDPPPPDPPPYTRAAVEVVLDEWVRPALARDGGSIEVVALVGSEIHVRLGGACRGCASQDITLRDGIERVLRDELPGFTSLVQVA